MGKANTTLPIAPGAGDPCAAAAADVDEVTETVTEAEAEPSSAADDGEREQVSPAATPRQDRLTVPLYPETGEILIWYAACPLARVCAVELPVDAPTLIAVPLPMSVTDCGLVGKLSTMVNVPVWLPVLAGSKKMPMAQENDGCTLFPHVLRGTKPAVAVTEEMVKGASPVFSTVTTEGALLVPTYWEPKLNVGGETEIVGPTT